MILKRLQVFVLICSLGQLTAASVEAQTKAARARAARKPSVRTVTRTPNDAAPIEYDAGRIRFYVNPEDTNGQYSVVELTEMPGYKTAWHQHNTWDESFYVIEGTLTAKIGDKQHEFPAGSFILIPRGTPHGQGNFGTVPVRLLLTISPSGFEQMFVDRIELFKTIKPTDSKFKGKFDEIRRKHSKNVQILGSWDRQ